MEERLNSTPANAIGKCEAIKKVFELVHKAASSDSTVMICGESGTGKELIAQALHRKSPRVKGPFIPVNCAAIPHDLLEAEMFGHEKGAFTGAVSTRIGRLEMADKGTIFLDEIGDMPTVLQVKMLRVLAEREVDRIGGTKSIKVDIRVITATHQNLESLIENGKFRKDLFYRLNVIPIFVPPLRERKSDIPLLANHYLQFFNESKKKSINGINNEAMEILINYSWPGNIRELVNFIERMVVLNSGNTITPRDLPDKILGGVSTISPPPAQPEPNETPAEAFRQSISRSFFVGLPENGMNLKQAVESFEREIILEALEKTNWVKNKAAVLLSLNRTTLVEKLKKLCIKRDE